MQVIRTSFVLLVCVARFTRDHLCVNKLSILQVCVKHIGVDSHRHDLVRLLICAHCRRVVNLCC
ncbi:hypothetical protein M758_2G230200 [Ceratodon purpureus]|nr:hypothetical protein M758_2G230200 [Ceratodon purpureus]